MPRSIAQVKQPKYKLIKTGFLPLVSPSHSISPNLVGVFYIGITPHEPFLVLFARLVLMSVSWHLEKGLDVMSLHDDIKFKFLHENRTKSLFLFTPILQFWMFGYQTGEVRQEPWPQTHGGSGLGVLGLTPSSKCTCNQCSDTSWKTLVIFKSSSAIFPDILFKTLQGVRIFIWLHIFFLCFQYFPRPHFRWTPLSVTLKVGGSTWWVGGNTKFSMIF